MAARMCMCASAGMQQPVFTRAVVIFVAVPHLQALQVWGFHQLCMVTHPMVLCTSHGSLMLCGCLCWHVDQLMAPVGAPLCYDDDVL